MANFVAKAEGIDPFFALPLLDQYKWLFIEMRVSMKRMVRSVGFY